MIPPPPDGPLPDDTLDALLLELVREAGPAGIPDDLEMVSAMISMRIASRVAEGRDWRPARWAMRAVRRGSGSLMGRPV